jgi:hypothetical protein
MTTCLLSLEAKDPSLEFTKISIMCIEEYTFHRPSVSSSSVVTLEDDVKSTIVLAKSLASAYIIEFSLFHSFFFFAK